MSLSIVSYHYSDSRGRGRRSTTDVSYTLEVTVILAEFAKGGVSSSELKAALVKLKDQLKASLDKIQNTDDFSVKMASYDKLQSGILYLHFQGQVFKIPPCPT